MVGVAMSAEGWFGDATSLNLDRGLQVTDGATEQGRVDLRDQIGRANNHAGDCDQLINICGRMTMSGSLLWYGLCSELRMLLQFCGLNSVPLGT